MENVIVPGGRRTLLDMNAYQWTVLLAAWLGWGFDIFDSLLMNYVAPNAVPTLLGIPLGTPAAQAATLQWTGILTSILLLGWCAGGIIFGKVCDRIGRTKTLLLTMVLYSVGTAACAFAPNIWVLLVFRIISSLGIGGEWAAGAAMVAEVVPENRRVEAGALLYTASPLGLFLATFVTYQVTGVYFTDPATSWRYVFLFGLAPAAVAFIVRLFIKEPDRWKNLGADRIHPKIRELFGPKYRALTISGLAMAMTALVTWWSCNAFISVVAKGLAQREWLQLTAAGVAGLPSMEVMGQQWVRNATNIFNLGGLIATLLTIPAAKFLGRKKMFLVYFLGSAAALMLAFGLDLDPQTRLYMYFPIGLTTYGIFGSFTFYLPELFPTRLRGTGAGFTYNIGRLIAAFGPFLVGSIAASGANALDSAIRVLFWVGIVPLLGVAALPLVIETRGRALED
ncbi:MAG TPA: MFS transporter [Pyrinomonadaceae bacterium]|jgi:MFS family permease|nr:MFS transporter [Pyrinomonadaceae bacterium]